MGTKISTQWSQSSWFEFCFISNVFNFYAALIKQKKRSESLNLKTLADFLPLSQLSVMILDWRNRLVTQKGILNQKIRQYQKPILLPSRHSNQLGQSKRKFPKRSNYFCTFKSAFGSRSIDTDLHFMWPGSNVRITFLTLGVISAIEAGILVAHATFSQFNLIKKNVWIFALPAIVWKQMLQIFLDAIPKVRWIDWA